MGAVKWDGVIMCVGKFPLECTSTTWKGLGGDDCALEVPDNWEDPDTWEGQSHQGLSTWECNGFCV